LFTIENGARTLSLEKLMFDIEKVPVKTDLAGPVHKVGEPRKFTKGEADYWVRSGRASA